MLTISYRSRARTVWILLLMSTEICRLGEGHSLRRMGMLIICWKTFPAKTTKMLYTRNSSILIVGLACAPIVETRFLELAMSLLNFSPQIPLGTFSIFPSSSVYLLFESECSLQTRVLRDLKLNICIRFPFFVNEGVSYNSCKSAFKFLVRNGCVKGRKIKGLYVCDKVEIWRFKMIW